MGRNLKGKELGEGIYQQANGTYCARFIDRFGKRKSKRSKKLQEVRQWLADATYINEHSDIEQATNMMVDAWFEYWIDVKKKTVRPNTVRNYTERYNKNIQKIIGRKILTEVKPIHCQKIFTDMAEEGYKTSTIYQTRIALFNMLEFAKENEVILSNPCKKSVKSDMGKPSQKKEALTIDIQKKFIEYAKGQSYENQFRFILQTGLRTGELVGLKWEDIDFSKKAIRIQRSMEYRYSVGEWRIGEPKSKAGYDTALFKICDKAKINRFSMHVLRHTFATRCIEGGMMPKTLQKILGHSNIGITMNLYVHITEDEKQKEIDKVSCVLNVG